jgi:hypothetical protein
MDAGEGTQAQAKPSTRWLLWIVLAAALCAALLLNVVGKPEDTVPQAPERQSEARPHDVIVVPGDAVVRIELPGESQRANQAPDAPIVPSFDGRGRIRGSVALPPGMAMPREWDLIVEPHPFLQGSEHAVRRKLRFSAGEREFAVEDLPLAGYAVRAEAKGMNSFACDVLLVRGAEDQFAQPQLSMAGFLGGSVIDAQGLPAEQVRVRVTRLVDQRVRETWSDPAGQWQIPELPDGEYQVEVLGAGQSLLHMKLIAFQAPRMGMEPVQLPPSTTLHVRVVDLLGRPARGVKLSGFGRPRGHLEDECDEQGECKLRWMEAGTWRISVRDEVEGLSARGDVELVSGEQAELVLRLARTQQ